MLLLCPLSLPSSPGAAGEAVARAVTLEEGPGEEVVRLVRFTKLEISTIETGQTIMSTHHILGVYNFV